MMSYKLKRLFNKIIEIMRDLVPRERICYWQDSIFIKDFQAAVDILNKNNVFYKIIKSPLLLEIPLQENLTLIKKIGYASRKYTNEDLELLYEKHGGNINQIAKEMGVTRQCAWQHITRYLNKRGTFFKKHDK